MAVKGLIQVIFFFFLICSDICTRKHDINTKKKSLVTVKTVVESSVLYYSAKQLVHRFYPKRLTLHSSYSFTFDQLLLSLGIEPMILVLLAPCSTI